MLWLGFTLINDFVDGIDVDVLLLEKIYKKVLSRVIATGRKRRSNELVFNVAIQGGYSFESLDKVLHSDSQDVVGLALVGKGKKRNSLLVF